MHYVSIWANATSISDRRESVYARDLTLRYPIRVCFGGTRLRLRFSNLTGTQPVTLTRVFVAIRDEERYQPIPVTLGGFPSITIDAGHEITTDEVDLQLQAGQVIDVSIYLGDYTQMNAGTLITGPLSMGQYSYGNHAEKRTLPLELTRKTQWFYFLNTIDLLTDDSNHALICYGDSITAQSWPDYLAQRAFEHGSGHVSVIRRAVSGTRILRQYDCITYQAYGLKGATRFPIEMNVAGATDIIIQHGINDIIHPVGAEVNPFRPWSDMPTLDQLVQGVEQIYLSHARQLGLRVWSGTLLPIEGWRTYNADRDRLRRDFNEWLRTSPQFDGCIDFDQAVRDPRRPTAFAPGFDSGDHLHPSESAYIAMASAVPQFLLE